MVFFFYYFKENIISFDTFFRVGQSSVTEGFMRALYYENLLTIIDFGLIFLYTVIPGLLVHIPIESDKNPMVK